MTTINNYDQSSTGVNIEFVGCCDSDLSRIYVQECFEPIAGKDDTYYYIEFGNVPNRFEDIEFKLKGKKADLLAFLKDYSLYSFDYKGNKEYLTDIILDTLANMESNVDYTNFAYFNNQYLKTYSLELLPSLELEKIISKGYSQGDRIEVYYSLKDLEKAWGKPICEDTLQEQIDHFLWDCPITARLIINDVDYYYELDSYDWKRDEWLKIVSEESGVPYETLNDLVPSELDYS